MFCHLVSSAGNDKAGGGGDVKRVLPVASGAYDVNVTFAAQGDGYAGFQYAVAESQQLVDGDSAHLQTGQQGGYLFVGVFTLRDAYQDGFHLLAGELFVV